MPTFVAGLQIVGNVSWILYSSGAADVCLLVTAMASLTMQNPSLLLLFRSKRRPAKESKSETSLP